MVTVDDLRNEKRKSGYRQVNAVRPNTPNAAFQAYAGRGRGGDWRGPSRETALEAAEDYCAHVNGLYDLPGPTSLNYPGHAVRPKEELPSEVQDALGVLRDHKAQKRGRQGYVYLIGVKGDFYAVKIGYSVNPEARVGELQTGNPRELYLLAKMPGTLADEKAIHARFKHLNLIGEWFKGNLELIHSFDDHRVARREP